MRKCKESPLYRTDLVLPGRRLAPSAGRPPDRGDRGTAVGPGAHGDAGRVDGFDRPASAPPAAARTPPRPSWTAPARRRTGPPREVVQRRQHGQTAVPAQPVDQLEHWLLVADVEHRRRLVKQQHARLARQRPRQHHPLPLAADIRASGAARTGPRRAARGRRRPGPSPGGRARPGSPRTGSARGARTGRRSCPAAARLLRDVGDQPGPVRALSVAASAPSSSTVPW